MSGPFPPSASPEEMRLRQRLEGINLAAKQAAVDEAENPALAALCRALAAVSREFAYGNHDGDAQGKAALGCQSIYTGIEWLCCIDTPEVMSRGRL